MELLFENFELLDHMGINFCSLMNHILSCKGQGVF